MKRLFLIGVTILNMAAAVRGVAQTDVEATTRPGVAVANTYPNASTDWREISLQKEQIVVVIRSATPQQRYPCRIREFRADSLVCSRPFHHDVVLPATQVLAILDPKRPDDDRTLRIWGVTGAVLVAAGFFAGPAAPVLWVVGGLVLLTWPAAAIGADNGPAHDSVLYFVTGYSRTLPLRCPKEPKATPAASGASSPVAASASTLAAGAVPSG